MAPAAQTIRNQEILKTEYSKKAAIGALYGELSKGIGSTNSPARVLSVNASEWREK